MGARIFVPGKPYRSSVMLNSSLMALLISYKENEVLWIWWVPVIICIHNTSLSSQVKNGPNNLESFSVASLSQLVVCNTSLLGLFVSCEENEVMWIWSQESYSPPFTPFITVWPDWRNFAPWATLAFFLQNQLLLNQAISTLGLF